MPGATTATEDEQMIDAEEMVSRSDRMRTTIRIPPTLVVALREYADRDERTLNAAMLKLMRIGLEAAERTPDRN